MKNVNQIKSEDVPSRGPEEGPVGSGRLSTNVSICNERLTPCRLFRQPLNLPKDLRRGRWGHWGALGGGVGGRWGQTVSGQAYVR